MDTVEKIDQIISAELPCKESDPELYEIITKNMVHGPCGDLNPKSPCMAKDSNGQLKCTKRFPKAFSEETVLSENGYPTYKRSTTVQSSYTIPNPLRHRNDRLDIDNRWIVPYNPYLSKKYKAHINVECCQGVAAIKYINKYVYKGSDRTTLRLSDTRDEIEKHLQGRYIGPTEAFGRIFEYKIHEEDPTVTTLALHLPNEQPVYFPEDASAPQILDILANSSSMLIAYFKYYESNPTSQKHLYQDFPNHFVWKQNSKSWVPRKKGFAIGRIPFCSPTCGERYYLRLLLVNVAGSKSFDELKNVNGVQCATFKQACVQLHLIEDDQEWTKCFQEAYLFSSGHTLRNLFVTALVFGQLIDPMSLWLEFRDSICDDLQHKLEQMLPVHALVYMSTGISAFYNEQASMDYGLHLIEKKLKDFGKSLGDFNLPYNKYNWATELGRIIAEGSNTGNPLIDEQLLYNHQDEESAYRSKYEIFNADQKQAFDFIVHKLQSFDLASDSNPSDSDNNMCFFLHGPAGTGKTFVYNTLCNYLRGQKKIVLCVASSGIASLLLTGGRTSHFRFKIPLKLNESSTCNIQKNGKLAELLRQTSLIIWDEVPMQNKACFEAVDRTLRDVCSNQSLFGGIPVVLGGDFAQIPPVIKNGTRTSIVEASIKHSYIWRQTHVLRLHMNMRVVGTSSNDVHFKKWLYLMTYNTRMQNARIPLPQYISKMHDLTDIIAKVYSSESLTQALDNPSLLYKSAILTSKNSVVDSINEEVLNLMPGEPVTLISADKADYSDEENSNNELYRVSNEYLQTLNPGNFPPAKLTLKVGCIVMLLRNLNPQRGLCNGTRLIIKNIGQYVLEVVVMNDQNDGNQQIEFIPRITLTTFEDDYPFILSRKQFPIKLSFAMTINKSQGQSLTNVGIDLRSHLFTHGQLYVAFSRSTNLQGIHVLLEPESQNQQTSCTDSYIDNIIYPELLL